MFFLSWDYIAIIKDEFIWRLYETHPAAAWSPSPLWAPPTQNDLRLQLLLSLLPPRLLRLLCPPKTQLGLADCTQQNPENKREKPEFCSLLFRRRSKLLTESKLIIGNDSNSAPGLSTQHVCSVNLIIIRYPNDANESLFVICLAALVRACSLLWNPIKATRSSLLRREIWKGAWFTSCAEIP